MKDLLLYTAIVPGELPIPLMIWIRCRLPTSLLLLKLPPRLAGYLTLFHLPVGRNAWLCMTCGRAQPDTPPISHIGAGFDGQLAAGLWVRNSVYPEKDSDTN